MALFAEWRRLTAQLAFGFREARVVVRVVAVVVVVVVAPLAQRLMGRRGDSQGAAAAARVRCAWPDMIACLIHR